MESVTESNPDSAEPKAEPIAEFSGESDVAAVAEAVTVQQRSPMPENCATLRQTVFRWSVPAAAPSQPSPQQVEAIADLIHVLESLRSPDSGWPAEVPYTPETLLPYVLDEVDAVLEAGFTPTPPQVSMPSDQTDSAIGETLFPQMLWELASSAMDGMQLLEGIPGNIHAQNADEAQEGMLRLVPTVCLKTDGLEWAMDLATNQPPRIHVEPTTHVQSAVCCLCPEFTPVADVLQELANHGAIAASALQGWMQGQTVQFLSPGGTWQSGTLSLRLGLEFVPQPLSSSENALDLAATDPTLFLRFPDAIGQTTGHKAFTHTVIQRAIATPSIFSPLEPTEEPNAASQVVQLAWEVLNYLHSPLIQPNSPLGVEATTLEALRRWLLWSLSRGSYRMTTLLGGFATRLLKPNQDWQHGLLKLQAYLAVKTLDVDWIFDVATGQMLPEPGLLTEGMVPEEAIAYSNGHAWCLTPVSIQDLYKTVVQAVQTHCPDLQSLLDGVELEAAQSASEAHPWEPGALRLHLTFEFFALPTS
jgi:hypothetical protein